MAVTSLQHDGLRTPRWRGHLRLLVIGWCLWLLGSWGGTLLIDSTVPSTRWMVYASAVGLMLIWPAVRLSMGAPVEASEPQPVYQSVLVVLADWVSLNLVFQAVVWPLQLIAGWSWAQSVWLAGAIAGWSALAGLVTAWGRWMGRPVWRTIAMVLCVAILFGEPLILWLGGIGRSAFAGRWTMRVSPIQTLWDLTAPPEVFELGGVGVTVVTISAAAGAGWLVLLGCAAITRDRF